MPARTLPSAWQVCERSATTTAIRRGAERVQKRDEARPVGCGHATCVVGGWLCSRSPERVKRAAKLANARVSRLPVPCRGAVSVAVLQMKRHATGCDEGLG
jgi:hypothetical protein